MVEPRNYRIDRFDPLLRDLLSWGLVHNGRDDGDGDGTDSDPGAARWQLTDQAQQRLSELATRVAPPASDQVLYLDRLCAHCRQRLPTRLTEAGFLCDACRQRAAEPEPGPGAASGSSGSSRAEHKAHWHIPKSRAR